MTFIRNTSITVITSTSHLGDYGYDYSIEYNQGQDSAHDYN